MCKSLAGVITVSVLTVLGLGCAVNTTGEAGADALGPKARDDSPAGAPVADVPEGADAPAGVQAPPAPPACSVASTFDASRAVDLDGVAAAGSWSFVGVPESRCMNGSATGFGVNVGSSREHVLLYFEGGGACFDLVTCAAAAHANGFTGTDLTAAVRNPSRGVLNRSDPSNPYREWTYVFVPYCSGDVHAGENPSGPWNRMHMGFANVRHALERIVPTFAGATRVLVTGSSAGGFGAAYNYDQIADAFRCAEVDLLDDAGIPMGDEFLKPCLQRLWRDTWRLDKTLPRDCPDCGAGERGGLSRVLSFIAEKNPTRRFAYLSATEDVTIRTFFGYGFSDHCDSLAYMDGGAFTRGLLDVRDRVLRNHANAAMFIVGGAAFLQHTFLGDALAKPSASGVTLATWLGWFSDHQAPWWNAGP